MKFASKQSHKTKRFKLTGNRDNVKNDLNMVVISKLAWPFSWIVLSGVNLIVIIRADSSIFIWIFGTKKQQITYTELYYPEGIKIKKRGSK
ncbi:MAG: hypothetical protein HQK65_01100 [Desulfamplus sp.]|nr:hypothetical protein [Desulfamplus sp.]